MTQFLKYMQATGKLRLTISDAAREFRAAHPEFTSAGDFWPRLLAALQALEYEGHLKLPSGGWDRTLIPAMPRTVSLGKREAAPIPAAVAWVGQLSFAAHITHRVTRSDLAAVNAWLAARRDRRRVVPTQERSLEIFGDEKRLDQLREGSEWLFDGRLSLVELDCRVVDPPLSFELSPVPGPIIVVENMASYDSFCRHNADPISDHPFGAVAWGAGGAFQKSWSRLADIAKKLRTDTILYLGDIDKEGLAILASVARQGQVTGLSVRPHVTLYRWLIQNGKRVPVSRTARSMMLSNAIADLFPSDVVETIRPMLAAGIRIPQEALGLETLRDLSADVLRGDDFLDASRTLRQIAG